MVIHNGTNTSSASSAATPGRSGPRFALWLAVIALAGVAIGFLAFRKTGTDPEKTGPVPETAEASNTGKLLAPNGPGDSGSSGDPSTASGKTGPVPIVATTEKEGPVPDVSTVSPADETGTGPETAVDSTESGPPPDPPYKSQTEQLISWLESIPPGEDVPPLPIDIDDNLEKDADKAAANVIEIGEGDSDEQAAHKENVGWTKLDLEEARKQGWTAAEYLKALEAERNEDAEFLRERKREFKEILANPDLTDDQCLQALAEINAELAERGIAPIEPPYEGKLKKKQK